jgi:hypothetical protein
MLEFFFGKLIEFDVHDCSFMKWILSGELAFEWVLGRRTNFNTLAAFAETGWEIRRWTISSSCDCSSSCNEFGIHQFLKGVLGEFEFWHDASSSHEWE